MYNHRHYPDKTLTTREITTAVIAAIFVVSVTIGGVWIGYQPIFIAISAAGLLLSISVVAKSMTIGLSPDERVSEQMRHEAGCRFEYGMIAFVISLGILILSVLAY